MDFGSFSFGSLTIDGIIYDHDVIIDRGKIRKRKKKPSKKFREQFGHTPLSVEEAIPWKCRNLVIGTGRYGSLPVMDEVRREARRRGIALLILPTEEAIQTLATKSKDTNAGPSFSFVAETRPMALSPEGKLHRYFAAAPSGRPFAICVPRSTP
jgi:hypothetical protein